MDGVAEVEAEVEVAATEESVETPDQGQEDNTVEEPKLSESLTSKTVVDEDASEETTKDSSEESASLFADVSLPEGVVMDATALEAFEPLLKEFNPSPEQAQSFADAYLGLQESRFIDANKQIESERSQHVKQLKDDPEFGGDRFEDNMKHVSLAVQHPEGQELAQVMLDYGMDNHPVFIKYLASVGRNLREDSVIGGGSRSAAPSDPADALFPSTKGQ